MLEKLTPRTCNWLLFAASVSAMGMAYYLDGVLGLEPCPLCITQRAFVVGGGLFCLLAAVQGPARTGRRIYAGSAALWAAGGGAVAARHVWLQHLPEDLVPACGPSLEYMLAAFPLPETLAMVLMGDGNCADVVWTMFGMSIPEQALILFSGLLVANLWQLLRK